MINLSLVKISSNNLEINLITDELLQDIEDFNLNSEIQLLKVELLNKNALDSSILPSTICHKIA